MNSSSDIESLFYNHDNVIYLFIIKKVTHTFVLEMIQRNYCAHSVYSDIIAMQDKDWAPYTHKTNKRIVARIVFVTNG